MKDYVIFTDGDVDLPSPYDKEISYLPQYYYFDDNMIYGDEQVLSREEFFERLSTLCLFPPEKQYRLPKVG